MNPIQRTYLNTRYGQLHCRLAGESGSHALLLLHQTASSGAMFETLMPHLNADFILAPDTPGFGASFIPTPFSIPLAADAIFQTLNGLGIQTVDIFGHHTGAAIALQMGTDHPDMVRTLALSGPPLLSPTQKEKLVASITPPLLDEPGTYLQNTWQRLRGRAPEAPFSFTLRETLLTLSAGACYAEAYHAVFEQDVAGQLAAVTCPVLVMAGEHDTLRASLEPARALLQNGRVEILPGAGPYLCDFQAEQVAMLLNSFFAMECA